MRSLFVFTLLALAPASAAQSGPLPTLREKCGTPARDLSFTGGPNDGPSDCAYSSNNPLAVYAPTFVYDIPVVVHVIQHSNGDGYISPTMVQSQIDILNEDFLALTGTNGAPGTDCQVRFSLATTDPGGSSTTGITYSVDNNWFNDNGSYWNSLGWDTDRYMNIYTNDASGYLGYVPDLPQGGIVGQSNDRIVVYWESFGRNSPYGAPYDQGRTATHEVGHYLGLYHTFDGGCASTSGCNSNGDLICDTNPESGPNWDCPSNPSSCGSSDPVHNYMDYTDDLCMWEFTQEQARRMRCTLEFWRPDLWTVGAACGVGTNYCTAGVSTNGCQATLTISGTPSATATSGFDLMAAGVEGAKDALFFWGYNGRQANSWGSSSSYQCVVPPAIRGGLLPTTGTSGACDGSFSQDLNALWCSSCPRPAKNPGAGATLNAQLWYRDPFSTSNQTTALSDAIEFGICP
jgi:hypothetical protein